MRIEDKRIVDLSHVITRHNTYKGLPARHLRFLDREGTAANSTTARDSRSAGST